MPKLTDKAFDFITHHYFKTMMVSGLIKSTVGTFLMTIGGSILVYSFVQPGNYAWHAPIIGVILIGLGVLVYFIGDLYKIYQKRQEEKALIERLEILEEKLCSDINELKQCQGMETGYCRFSFQGIP